MCRDTKPIPERDGKFRAHIHTGSMFLEKNGTFINAECGIGRMRKVIPSRSGLEEWGSGWQSPLRWTFQ